MNEFDPKQQPKFKYFSANAGLTAEGTMRPSKSGSTTPTLSLELAPGQARKIDWAKKIDVQLSNAELAIFCATLLGYLPKCEFKRARKGITIERQANRLHIRASAAEMSVVNVGLDIGNTVNLSALALSRLEIQQPQTAPELLLASLKGATALFRNEPS